MIQCFVMPASATAFMKMLVKNYNLVLQVYENLVFMNHSRSNGYECDTRQCDSL